MVILYSVWNYTVVPWIGCHGLCELPLLHLSDSFLLQSGELFHPALQSLLPLCFHQDEAPFISCCFIPFCSQMSIWHFSRSAAVTFLLLLPVTWVQGLLRRRDGTKTDLVFFTHLPTQGKTKSDFSVRPNSRVTRTLSAINYKLPLHFYVAYCTLIQI